jgi:outer membrane protein OmpA-like peptidoglycan-associated protein
VTRVTVSRPRAALFASTAGVLLLAACSGAAPGKKAPAPGAAPPVAPSATSSSGAGPDGADEGVVVTGTLSGVPVEVEVGPAVREGDLAVLRVETTVTADEGKVTLWDDFRFVFHDISRPAPDNVRLVDTEALTVSPTAEDPQGDHAVENKGLIAEAGGPPVAFHGVYAAPSGDSAAVLLPQLGLVTDVPVVDEAPVDWSRDEDAATTVAELADLVGSTPQELTAAAHPLESFREIAGGDVRAHADGEDVTVAIDSDVLFGVDSDELTGAADAALTAAGEELGAADGGAVSIVGHTDDVDTDEHNQELSERRAAAVAERLGQLVDLSGFEVTVEGRGESEPVASGTSEKARALNRRVELIFTPSVGGPGSAPAPSDVPLPGTSGPTGTATDGVVVTQDDQEVRVDVTGVRRVGDVFVGDLRLERLSGEPGSVAWPLTQAAWDSRGTFSPDLQFAATGVSLLVGDERIFPLDYHDGDDDRTRMPLADLAVNDEVAVGESTTVTVVWPAVDARTVTVDVPPVEAMGSVGGNPWRIVDVPVAQPGQ